VKLPNPDAVEIELRKVQGYLLSAKHPTGRHRARFFAALGFQQTSTPDFILELRRIAATEDVLSVEETEFGRKYTIVGQLKGPIATASIRTIWIKERGRPLVRLVTVVPRAS
jgi:uncharacterized protein DUF6883